MPAPRKSPQDIERERKWRLADERKAARERREADKNLRPNKATRQLALRQMAALGEPITEAEYVRRINKQRAELGLAPWKPRGIGTVSKKTTHKKASRKKVTRKKVATKTLTAAQVLRGANQRTGGREVYVCVGKARRGCGGGNVVSRTLKVKL